jgi:hypothetical protein
MKHTYLCIWPNGTITVARAANPDELFFILDEEGDPTIRVINEQTARIYKLPPSYTAIRTEGRGKRIHASVVYTKTNGETMHIDESEMEAVSFTAKRAIELLTDKG